MRPAIDGRREAQRLAALYWPLTQNDEVPAAGGGRDFKGVITSKQSPCANPISMSLPRNWRGRLPAPLAYYRDVVPNMSITNGVGRGHCPLHTDTKRSFLVRLEGTKGTWSCPTCGTGDMVTFVQRFHGIGFVEAVRHLVVGGAK